MAKPRYLLPAFLLLCVFCDYWLARSIQPNADTAQNYNELLSLHAGNFLLSHWALGIDNFYFTDLPFFTVLSWIFGMRAWLIYVVPVIVFALLLLAGMLLIRRARPVGEAGWIGPALFLLLAGVPCLHGQNVFLLVADIHIATLMFCLYAILIVEPVFGGRRIRWPMWLGFFLLSFAAVASDPIAALFLSGPLLLLVIFRAWLHPAPRLGEWIAVGVMLLATVLSVLFRCLIAYCDGFSTYVNIVTGFVPNLAGVLANLGGLTAALQILFGAHGTMRHLQGAQLFYETRFLTEVLVLLLCVRIAWRAPRAIGEAIPQLLVLAALTVCAADSSGQAFSIATQPGPGYPTAAIRYVTPMFILLAIASAIEAQAYLQNSRGRKVALGAGVIIAAVFAFVAVQAVAQAAKRPAGIVKASQYPLARWLKAETFHYGVADYWTAGLLLPLSHNAVVADAVSGQNGLVLFPFNTDASRFIDRRRPQFVAFSPGNSSGVTLADAERTYGMPSEIDQVAGCTVLIYHAH